MVGYLPQEPPLDDGETVMVGRCMLIPGCPHARVDRAWFQRVKLKYDEPFSSVACTFDLRRYMKENIEVGVAGIKADVAEYNKIAMDMTLPDCNMDKLMNRMAGG
jgi:hypothetical protein